jgi:hypothetical protein
MYVWLFRKQVLDTWRDKRTKASALCSQSGVNLGVYMYIDSRSRNPTHSFSFVWDNEHGA